MQLELEDVVHGYRDLTTVLRYDFPMNNTDCGAFSFINIRPLETITRYR